MWFYISCFKDGTFLVLDVDKPELIVKQLLANKKVDKAIKEKFPDCIRFSSLYDMNMFSVFLCLIMDVIFRRNLIGAIQK